MNNNKLDFSPKMTEREDRAWKVLKNFPGRAAAVKSEQFEAFLEISYREFQQIVRSLRIRHKKPIVSCGQGYYIAQTVEEKTKFSASMRSRGIADLMVASAIMGTTVEEELRQGMLEFTRTIGGEGV